jgi:putative peptidoglycan lipid II flippase
MVVLSLGLSREIVDIVFGRGAFLERDVSAAAAIFRFYVYGIMFVAVREIFNRLLFSFQKTAIPLYIGLLAAAVNVVISITLTRLMGPPGIAAGAAASAMFYVICQVAYTLVWKRALLGGDILRWLLVVGLASAAMAAALAIVLPAIDSGSSAVRVLIAGSVSGTVYMIVLLASALFVRPIRIAP